MEFHEADAILHHKTSGVKLDRRKVQNNTWLERRDDHTIAVRLHDTDIVTYHRDSTIALRAGGWYTKLTSERIHDYARPFHVRNIDGRWVVMFTNPKPKDGQWDTYWLTVGDFYEGVTLDLTRPLSYTASIPALMARKYDDHILNLISKYIRGLTPSVYARVRECDEALDCHLCSAQITAAGNQHLIDHLKEKRYEVALICAAIRETERYADDYWDRYSLGTIKTFLRRYFKAHLLVGNYGGRRPTAAYHTATGWH